jgi:molybdopterin/thiamine biosynthesis adenylyltransferase
LPFGNTKQVGVTILVSDATASLPSVQHTAWMLVNLLGRFQGVVHRLSVRCPAGVKLCGRVVPLATRDVDLATALIDGGNAIGVVPIEKDLQLERTIAIGTGPFATAADLFVLGDGWCGGISVTPESFDTLDLHSSLPFGPYVAACIAAAEVFKAARMRPGHFISPTSAFYSCWNHVASDAPISGGPSDVEVVLDASLVGIGAVGSSVVHAIWASPNIAGSMVLIDNDPKGLETTNLNRYPLFGTASVGQQKATAAARVASDAKVRWIPHDAAIESFDLVTLRVVSAVDRNSARAAIQFKYPARLFSGSTLDLRAEVLRCGPPGVGACLRCFNEPEKIAPDDVLRSKLKGANESEIAELARTAEITIDQATEWIATGRCGIAGDRLLPLLRRDDGEDAFAVAFVSVMAGTMLASELVKDHLADAAPLSESQPRVTFQFFSPLARSNQASAFRRDPNCPMCDPNSAACRIWAKRYQSVSKSKT